MQKTLAVIQPNYIPWKGYFDIIRAADEFILLDDVNYTKNDWRNRNRIKTRQGIQWLTIPVRVNSLSQKINQTLVADPRWNKKHWKTLAMNYSKAPCFTEYRDFFQDLYMGVTETNLGAINRIFIQEICKLLEISTRITLSSDYAMEEEDKNQRLIELCQKVSAARYLSGPAAKDYMDTALFEKNNIEVSYMDYSGYAEYPQLFPPFEHGVSIVDLLFNKGSHAREFLKNLV